MARPGRVTRNILIISAVILAVILVVLVGAIVIYDVTLDYMFDKLGNANTGESVTIVRPEDEWFETDEPEEEDTDPTDDSSEGTDESTEPSEETEPTPPPTAPNINWPSVSSLKDPAVYNILLVGKDESKQRTDSMILVTINTRNNTLHMTSFMRDLYVQIPGGYSDNRLNAAYAFGGKNLLIQAMKKNFGVNVDATVEINFQEFKKVIDILGGVTVNVDANERNIMITREGCNPNRIVVGNNHFNGDYALVYCRIRKIDSDHQRTGRQREVLNAIAESFRGASLTTIFEVIDKILPYVITDMTQEQFETYVNAAFRIFAGGARIQSWKIPEGTNHYGGATIRGMSVLLPNLTNINNYLKATIYGGVLGTEPLPDDTEDPTGESDETTESTGDTEDTGSTENTENTENTESTGSTENTEDTGNTENTESTGSTENTEDTGNTEGDGGSTQQTEESGVSDEDPANTSDNTQE